MKTTDEITNSQDLIDSRDVIARIEELRGQLDALIDAVADAGLDQDGTDDSDENTRARLAEWLGCEVSELPEGIENLRTDTDYRDYHSSDEARELYALEQLASEAEGCGDWHHGETLIRDSYFREYAEQMANDTGAIDRSAGWPACHIDWDAAAAALKMDYTSVSFDGVEYWMRS